MIGDVGHFRSAFSVKKIPALTLWTISEQTALSNMNAFEEKWDGNISESRNPSKKAGQFTYGLLFRD